MLTDSAIQRAIRGGNVTPEMRRRIIDSAKLPNGSYDLDSVAVRAFDAHLDRQIEESGRKIDPEIKYAMFKDVMDPSDKYDVMRVTEDLRSGRPNDPMDRVRTESINLGLSMSLHPNHTYSTSDLKFFRTLDDAKAFYNERNGGEKPRLQGYRPQAGQLEQIVKKQNKGKGPLMTYGGRNFRGKKPTDL